MQPFIGEDFLLQSEHAKTLYHTYAKHMPIIDFHCHINPQEIWEDRQFHNITQAWLGGDHYKWRLMRFCGVAERLITGDAPDKEKFMAYAKTLDASPGNPLVHWSHLELQRFFGIDTPLSAKTADDIYEQAAEKMQAQRFSARTLMELAHVETIFTTDDPADSLTYHTQIKEQGTCKTTILPAFRPDRVLRATAPDYAAYIQTLADAACVAITSYQTLLEALSRRVDFFAQNGCRACDHALDQVFFAPATQNEKDSIFLKALDGHPLSALELEQFKTGVLQELSKYYYKKGWVMELHIGALRNNSTRALHTLGPDTGFDAVDDGVFAGKLSALLDSMDKEEHLPKTLLFNINVRDHAVLAALMGAFCQEGIRGKVQMGTSWWFVDHKRGMEQQMETYANLGALGTFVGMLTDSRSFLSYPRHEYFRRILCNLLGTWIHDGELASDIPAVGALVQDICYNNSKQYFIL